LHKTEISLTQKSVKNNFAPRLRLTSVCNTCIYLFAENTRKYFLRFLFNQTTFSDVLFSGRCSASPEKFRGEEAMKKLLTLSILSLSILGTASLAEAKSVSPEKENSAQIQRYGQPGRYNRRVRVVNRTRIVRVGFRTYRETIQTRYLPNGRTVTRVISRVRVR
jgi:hypothetical protein